MDLFHYILCICFRRSTTERYCTGRTHKNQLGTCPTAPNTSIYRLYALPPQETLSGRQQLLQMFLEDCLTRLNPHFVKEVRKHATSNKTKYATTIRNPLGKHCKYLLCCLWQHMRIFSLHSLHLFHDLFGESETNL